MPPTEAAAPLVSINIPCYRQLPYARRCLASILGQSFQDFEVTLIDDGASDEYERYAASLADPRVRYQRNPARLGAMGNMFGAIGAGAGRYSFAFHEDDLLSRGYLAAAVGILESRPECAFVAGELREFSDEPPASALAAVAEYPEFEVFRTPADMLRGILRGSEPMFGSVVYRRAALADATASHAAYATLVDRPFLLSMLPRWSGVVLRDPLVWYRGAAPNDVRHSAMTTDHIVQLFTTYKALLPEPMPTSDQALFYRYSGYWLFKLFDLTPEETRPPFREFLFRVWRSGLYESRWRGRFGLRLLRRALVGARTRSA